MIEQVINHIRNRDYMSGIERDRARVKATGEVFTPTHLVQDILDNLPQELFTDPNKTFLDNSCGDGQFLGEILIRKMEHGATFEQALSTIYGVDLMLDNVDECRRRLLCGREDLRHIVEQNIQWRNALKNFGYNFNPMGKRRRELEEKKRQVLVLQENKRQIKQKKELEKLEKERQAKLKKQRQKKHNQKIGLDICD